MCKLLIKRLREELQEARPIMDAPPLTCFRVFFDACWAKIMQLHQSAFNSQDIKSSDPAIRMKTALLILSVNAHVIVHKTRGNRCVRGHWAGAHGLRTGNGSEEPRWERPQRVLQQQRGLALWSWKWHRASSTRLSWVCSCCLQEIKASSSLGRLICRI